MPVNNRQLLLSKEEKEQIINRYYEIIDSMNAKLPNDKQIKPDVKSLLERFDDPNEIIPYRIGLRLNETRVRQDAALQELKQKHPQTVNDYGFKIQRYFLPQDSKDAKEYNEKIYTSFLKDPEKFMNHTFSELVNFNPEYFYDHSDDKGVLADYYYGNFAMVENAPALSNYIKNNPNVLPEIKEKKNTIVALTNGLNYLPGMTKKVTSIDYLACPKLTKEQAEALGEAYAMDSSNDIANKVHDLADKESPLPPKEYYKNLGLDKFLDKNSIDSLGLKINFVKSADIGGKPVNTEVSIAEFAQHKDDKEGDVRYEIKLDEKELNDFDYNTVTTTARQNVVKEFGKRLYEELDIKGTYDAKKLEDKFKGNIFERMRGTTSEEYKELIQAIKDYSDPKSPNYLNYDNMVDKAEDYLDHKEEQGYITAGIRFDWEANDVDQNPNEAFRLMVAAERHQELNYYANGIKAKELSGTSLQRSKLAQAIIDLGREKEKFETKAIGNSIEDIAETEKKAPKVYDLLDILEQDKRLEEDKVIEENAILEKADKNRQESKEMPFPEAYDIEEKKL